MNVRSIQFSKSRTAHDFARGIITLSILASLATAVAPRSLPADDPPLPGDIETLLDRYRERMKKGVVDVHAEAVKRLTVNFGGALQRKEAELVPGGNSGAISEIRDESRRVGNGEPPGRPEDARFLPLGEMRLAYHSTRSKMEIVRNEKALQLLRGFGIELSKRIDGLPNQTPPAEKGAAMALRKKATGHYNALTDLIGEQRRELEQLESMVLKPWLAPLPGTPGWRTTPGEVIVFHRNGRIPTDPPAVASIPAGLDDVVAIEPAGSCIFAIRANGEVIGWGDERKPALALMPKNLRNVVALSCSSEWGLALHESGRLTRWGGDGRDPNGPFKAFANIHGIHGSSNPILVDTHFQLARFERGEPVVPEVKRGTRGVLYHDGSGCPLALVREEERIVFMHKLGAPENFPRRQNREVVQIVAHTPVALRRDGTVFTWGKHFAYHEEAVSKLRNVETLAGGRERWGAAKIQDGGWVFWGEGVNAEECAKRAEGCTRIDFYRGWPWYEWVFGIRPPKQTDVGDAFDLLVSALVAPERKVEPGAEAGFEPVFGIDFAKGLGPGPFENRGVVGRDGKAVFEGQSWMKLRPEFVPAVDNRGIRISATVESGKSGVILAHGGDGLGYVFYLSGGRPVFEVCIQGKRTAIRGEPPLGAGRREVEVEWESGGRMRIRVEGKTVAEGTSGGTLPAQPKEGLVIGADDSTWVGNYENANYFDGSLSRIGLDTRR